MGTLMTSSQTEQWFRNEEAITKKRLTASQTALELAQANFNKVAEEEEVFRQTNTNEGFLEGSKSRVEEANKKVATAEKAITLNMELLQKLEERDESLIPVEVEPLEDDGNTSKRRLWVIAGVSLLALFVILGLFFIPKVTTTPTSAPAEASKLKQTSTAAPSVPVVQKDIAVVVPAAVSGVISGVSSVPVVTTPNVPTSAEVVPVPEKLPSGSLNGTGCIILVGTGGSGSCNVKGSDIPHKKETKKEDKNPELCQKGKKGPKKAKKIGKGEGNKKLEPAESKQNVPSQVGNVVSDTPSSGVLAIQHKWVETCRFILDGKVEDSTTFVVDNLGEAEPLCKEWQQKKYKELLEKGAKIKPK